MNQEAIDSIREEFNESKSEFKSFFVYASASLNIIISKLSDECAIHSQIYSRVASIQAKVHLIANKARLLVKEIEANISLEVRNNPESYSSTGKLTESHISDLVNTNTLVSQARNLKNEAEELLDRANGLLQAYEHRRSMLNNEVELFLSGHIFESKEAGMDDYKQQLKNKDPNLYDIKTGNGKIVGHVDVESGKTFIDKQARTDDLRHSVKRKINEK